MGLTPHTPTTGAKCHTAGSTRGEGVLCSHHVQPLGGDPLLGQALGAAGALSQQGAGTGRWNQTWAITHSLSCMFIHCRPNCVCPLPGGDVCECPALGKSGGCGCIPHWGGCIPQCLAQAGMDSEKSLEKYLRLANQGRAETVLWAGDSEKGAMCRTLRLRQG